MEQVILSSAQICDHAKSFQGLIALDVATDGELATADDPHMEVMDVLHLRDLEYVIIELLSVQVFNVRGTLHDNVQTVFEYRDGSEANDD
jgi:hypothetical protein